MLAVQRSVRQKVIASAAVALVLGGGAFAAVSATGQGDGHRHAHAGRGAHPRPRDLSAAADYLGISTRQLIRELGSSKSLAQVAQAHEGKSVQGLIEALVAARRARLSKAAASLPARVSAEVDRPATTAGPPAGRLGTSAADYLGITPVRLREQLQAGKTLAQLADATPGKSKQGLANALLAAKRKRLAARLANGAIVHERAARITRHLESRIEALLARKFVRSPQP
jgi:hypothetical protein